MFVRKKQAYIVDEHAYIVDEVDTSMYFRLISIIINRQMKISMKQVQRF